MVMESHFTKFNVCQSYPLCYHTSLDSHSEATLELERMQTTVIILAELVLKILGC